MTPQELKNSILQLAIQGKLVPQDQNDNPVDLTDIKQQKTDEFLFDLPINWEIVHLESITDSIPAKQYQILESQVLKDGDYPVISQSKEYSIGYSNEATKVFHHEKPVIAFGDHTTEIKIIDFDFIVGADGVKVFAPKSPLLPKYFYYVMLYLCIDLNKVGGYSRHYKYIKNKPIPLPPLAEQKRIVAKIEELLPLIDRYEAAYTKLEEFNARFPFDMQKSLLQMAIQGKLVPQDPSEGTGEELYKHIQAEKAKLIKEGKIKKEKPLAEISEDEIPFEIPDSWKWTRLDDLVSKEIKRGKSPTYTVKSGTLVFAQKCNTKAGHIDLSIALFLDETKLSKYPESEFMQDSDIIINSTGNGTLGRVGIYRNSDNPQMLPIVPDSHVTIIRASKNIYTQYLYYGLKNYQPYMEKLGSGSTNQTELSASMIKNLLFPLPPLAEQKRIVAKLEEILPLCELLK